jgi:hypothetical protein
LDGHGGVFSIYIFVFFKKKKKEEEEEEEEREIGKKLIKKKSQLAYIWPSLGPIYWPLLALFDDPSPIFGPLLAFIFGP